MRRKILVIPPRVALMPSALMVCVRVTLNFMEILILAVDPNVFWILIVHEIRHACVISVSILVLVFAEIKQFAMWSITFPYVVVHLNWQEMPLFPVGHLLVGQIVISKLCMCVHITKCRCLCRATFCQSMLSFTLWTKQSVSRYKRSSCLFLHYWLYWPTTHLQARVYS